MSSAVEELLDLLRLERLEDNLFRGQSRDIGTRFVFGGQVLGQALSAAQQTVDGARSAHSLHGYFLRAGDIDHPIIFNVERTRDGGSFSVRRVTAIQHGQPILNFSASFQISESGFEHQLPMPSVPAPADLKPADPLPDEVYERLPIKLQRWFGNSGPFEFRQVYPRDELNPPKRPPFQHVWFRLIERVPDDPALQRALLTYSSDFHLIGTAMLPHGISFLQGNVQVASLDHAMWFHRPFRVDEWLLYSCDSPTAQGARGLARGMIYSEQGRLVASTAQEGLVRLRADKG
ncbi:MAG: acyl-CoA thioesterase II [Dokdonella sp.]|uniref:acyl-CoA thioesterase n=1 Tax=Dokdonella sp. TaxID=2291710 RepID=UPI0025C6CEE1|nr:acyl-CoA thioesterase II [Dokdonella sp.]MBZ0222545.1 acyl-CoA thioesterase II [Dokdonella sp.]MCC7256133.1 acyl-CoA thioesterase II [Dokdonella sp.]